MLCVLVLPLPRSGSSMIGGILHHLGIDMGPCVPPDAANPRGYFEDVRFMGMHRAWSRCETDPARVRLRLPPWEPMPSAGDLARYARLIGVCAKQPRWGVKDPEFCYYAGYFAAILRQPIKVIATTRDKVAAAESLGARRHWLSPNDCDTIIAEYIDRQSLMLHELATHGISPALTINYDEALEDPEFIVKLIATYIDLPATAEAVAFVSPQLRRHRQVVPADTLHNDAQGLTTLTT